MVLELDFDGSTQLIAMQCKSVMAHYTYPDLDKRVLDWFPLLPIIPHRNQASSYAS